LVIRADSGQLKNGGREVLVLVVSRYAKTLGHLPGIAYNERDFQAYGIKSVVIEPAFVVVECFAMIAIEHNNRIVQYVKLFQLLEYLSNTGIHISDCAIIQGYDVIFILNALGKPQFEAVAEWFENKYRFHRSVPESTWIALIEHVIKRGRRKVGGVRIHVPKHDEKGLFGAFAG
jgi:hypothetical protein